MALVCTHLLPELTLEGVVVPTDEIVAALQEVLQSHASEFEGKNPAQKKSQMWKILGQNREKYLNFADECVL